MWVWKEDRCTIDVCVMALNSRSILKDECSRIPWTDPSIGSRISTFWWNVDRGNCNGIGGPLCRAVDHNIDGPKMKVEGKLNAGLEHHERIHRRVHVVHLDVVERRIGE